MQLKLDVKTLVIGILMGIIIAIAAGANSVGAADADRFGIALEKEGGYGLIRDEVGDFFIVNPLTAMATRVMVHRRLNYDPAKSRDDDGRIFNYYKTRRVEERGGVEKSEKPAPARRRGG